LDLVIADEPASHRDVPSTAPLVQQWCDLNGRVCALGYASGDRCWMEWPRLATYSFAPDCPVVHAYPKQSVQRRVVEDVFRRSVLPFALQASGWEALHASAVLMARGVVGFCAPSGTGKSTLAHGLSLLGYPTYADDALFVQVESEVIARRMPFGTRLRPASRAFFGSRAPSGPSDIAESAQRGLPSTRPLAALFTLHRQARPVLEGPSVRRLTPVPAFSAILAHAQCFNPLDPDAKRRLVSHYLSLAARVPVFELNLGDGFQHFAATLGVIVSAVNGAESMQVAR